jgi:hypothetical protein
MSKSKPNAPLFTTAPLRSRRILILQKYLYGPDPQNLAEAQFHHDSGPDFDKAYDILKKWADMERNGLLKKKETALDANFLNDVFGIALHFIPVEHAQPDGSFTLDRQFAVQGVGPVDGALGLFPLNPDVPGRTAPVAVIELKGADTDLDTDKSNGRTAVQQLFDYLNGLPDTHWGIVSNFSTIRLYHKSRGSQTYEIFSLQKLAADLDHFKAFWCLLEKGGLLPNGVVKIPRAVQLLTMTGERQKEVGDELYSYYADYRSELVATLRDDFNKPLEEAIRIAQKIFDRIIFVAFCEDRGFFPPNCLSRCMTHVGFCNFQSNPRWQNLQNLFWAVYNGHHELKRDDGIPISLFAPDDDVDACQFDDRWAQRLCSLPSVPLCDCSPESLFRGFPEAVEALRNIGLSAPQPSYANSDFLMNSVDSLLTCGNNECVLRREPSL